MLNGILSGLHSQQVDLIQTNWVRYRSGLDNKLEQFRFEKF